MSQKDQDESPEWSDDIEAFENQLRSLRPAPPARSWSSVAESIEASFDEVAEKTIVSPKKASVSSVPTTSAWKTVVSHCVTAAIGLAVGVAVMSMRPDNDPGLIDTTGDSDISNGPVLLVDKQVPEKIQSPASEVETPDAVLVADKTPRNRRRLSQASWKPTTLRVFGSANERLASGREWLLESSSEQDFSSAEDSNTSNTKFEGTSDKPVDQPALSPRSFRRFLDDLTYTPNSDNSFCKAEGFSS